MKITRSQFKEVEKNYWVMRYEGYRVAVHKVDAHIELSIAAIITSDPNSVDWDKIERTVNSFYRKRRQADRDE